MKTLKNRFLLSFLVLFSLILALSGTVSVQAATKKVKKMRLEDSDLAGVYTTTSKQADKKALTIKKGTTSVKFFYGFLKFKAPKKATYKFTFSAYKPSDPEYEEYNFAPIVFLKKGKKNVLTDVAIKDQKGEKIPFLMLFTKKSKALDEENVGDSKVTATIKLKKNEVLYIYTSSAFEMWNTMKVKVK